MRDLRHVVWLIGFVVLVALAATACAQATGSEPSPRPFNVGGTVLLAGPQDERPGAGLVVTARSPKARTRLVTTSTASDGSFHFQLKPGWYLLTVDYWGEPATQVKVPVIGVAAAIIAAPTEDRAATRAVFINDVPAVLPPHGVWLDGHLVLLKPPPAQLPHSVMSREKAVAGYENADGAPARGVLAVVTARGVRVGMKNPTKPLRDWLAWVIIRTQRRPINASTGGGPGMSVPPFLTLHGVSQCHPRRRIWVAG